MAVDTINGIWACLAGPGAGKTSVIVARHSRLMHEHGRGNVISLTFTKEAAAEMKKRAGLDDLADKSGRPSDFMTFHSLGLKFVMAERNSFPFQLAAMPLMDEKESAKLVGQAIRTARRGVEFKRFRMWMSNQKREARTAAPLVDALKKQLAQEPDLMKRADIASELSYAETYQVYEHLCRKMGVMDYDDLILQMAILLEQNPQVRARWQYEYIQIDESQDADMLQWRLIQLMSEKHGNVFAVGDGNQAIYAWRGAHPELFIEFEKVFPTAQRLYIGTNYRSTPEIVDLVKKVAPIKNELINRFRSAQASIGRAPDIRKFPTEEEEGKSIVRRIQGLYMEEEKPEIAILTRTNKGLRVYQDMLMEKGIKYRLLGKSGFWHQREVKDVVAYLQICYRPTDPAVATAIYAPYEASKFLRDKQNLVRELYAMRESSGESVLQALMHYQADDPRQQNNIVALRNALNHLRSFRNLEALPALQNILNYLKIEEHYADEEATEDIDNSPLENIKELKALAVKYKTLDGLMGYIERVQMAQRSRSGVALSTVHQAKGKEWQYVFLVNVNQGTLPHKKSHDIEEEKRIFFVAVSRAAKHLQISYSETPSQFITALQEAAPAEDDWIAEMEREALAGSN